MSTRARIVTLLVFAVLLGRWGHHVRPGQPVRLHLDPEGEQRPDDRRVGRRRRAPRGLPQRRPGPGPGASGPRPAGRPRWGPRAITDRTCDRVFAASGRTLCLASEPGLVTRDTAAVYDDTTGKRISIPLTGSPSRARLSSDGTLAATTSFVAGDSYAATTFSTRTVITELDAGRSVDLETFTVVDGGRTVTPVDRNFWGVTFGSDDDRFFVTVAFGGKTHLAEGRLSTRTVTTMRTDAECPSLSPDQSRVAYKKRGDRPRGDWRIAVLDLATGKETELAETRSVDDQVEWLDDDRVVYGLPGEGTEAAQTNVWVVRRTVPGRRLS